MITTKYLKMVALMALLQLILFLWNASTSSLFHISGAFGLRMLKMGGMCLLTVIIVLIARRRRTALSIWHSPPTRSEIAIALVSSLLIAIALIGRAPEVRALWLLLYGSIITPLFEETLFRGFIYSRQEQLHSNSRHIIALNAALFTLWHLGYIIEPLTNGEWMALTKLIVGFIYGVLLAYIRFRTKSTLCCILTHGALNVLAL